MNTGAHDVPAAFLQRFPETGGPAERIPIWKLPFIIGRSEEADLTVYSGKISKEHARLEVTDGRYAIRDLDSTNGTFVNGKKVSSAFLEDADIIHLAHVEFCFRHAGASPQTEVSEVDRLVEQTQHMVVDDHPHSVIRGSELLRELIDTCAVEILFQPIVDLRTRTALA